MNAAQRKARNERMGITPFDPAAGLDSVEEMAEYLSACLESGDMGVFMAAGLLCTRRRQAARLPRWLG
jgi:DNA-binding phage protein